MLSKSSVRMGKVGDGKKHSKSCLVRKSSEKWKRLLKPISRTNIVRKLSQFFVGDDSSPENFSKIKEELTERKMCIEKDLESLTGKLDEPLLQCVIDHGNNFEQKIMNTGNFEIKTEHQSGGITTRITRSDSGTLEIVTLIEDTDDSEVETKSQTQSVALPQSLSVQTMERERLESLTDVKLKPEELPSTTEIVKNVYDTVTKMLQKFNDNVIYALDQINKNMLKAIESLNQNVKSVLTVVVRDEIRSVMQESFGDQRSVYQEVPGGGGGEKTNASQNAESGDGCLTKIGAERCRRSLTVSLNSEVVSIMPEAQNPKPDVYLQTETFSTGYLPAKSTNSLLISSMASLTAVTEDVTEWDFKFSEMDENYELSVEYPQDIKPGYNTSEENFSMALNKQNSMERLVYVSLENDEIERHSGASSVKSEKNCTECVDGPCGQNLADFSESNFSPTTTSSAITGPLTEDVSYFNTATVDDKPHSLCVQSSLLLTASVSRTENTTKTSKRLRKIKEKNSISSSSTSTITSRKLSKRIQRKKAPTRIEDRRSQITVGFHRINCKCFDCVYTAYCRKDTKYHNLMAQEVYERHSNRITQHFEKRRKKLADVDEQIRKTRRTLEETERTKAEQRSSFESTLAGLQQALSSLKSRLKLTEAKAITMTNSSPNNKNKRTIQKKKSNTQQLKPEIKLNVKRKKLQGSSNRIQSLKGQQTSSAFLSHSGQQKSSEDIPLQEYMCMRNCERQLQNFLLAKKDVIDSGETSLAPTKKTLTKGLMKKNKTPKQTGEGKLKGVRSNLTSSTPGHAPVGKEGTVANENDAYRFKITLVH